MSWTLTWSWMAEHRDIFTIGYHPAERVCAALVLFAEQGRGPVVQLAPPDPRHLALPVAGAVAILFLDSAARTVFVRRIYRRK